MSSNMLVHAPRIDPITTTRCLGYTKLQHHLNWQCIFLHPFIFGLFVFLSLENASCIIAHHLQTNNFLSYFRSPSKFFYLKEKKSLNYYTIQIFWSLANFCKCLLLLFCHYYMCAFFCGFLLSAQFKNSKIHNHCYPYTFFLSFWANFYFNLHCFV